MKKIWIAAIALVLASITAKAESRCVVADPTGTPLNVRRLPGPSQIIGYLPNGTESNISEVTYHNGMPWARVGTGWVYKNYLKCNDPSFKFDRTEAGIVASFECFVSQEFPPSDHDVYKISVQLESNHKGGVSTLRVQHHAKSGTYNRAAQYVNTILTSSHKGSVVWVGNPRNDPSKTMTGEMRATNLENVNSLWVYSEDLVWTGSGAVVYHMESMCRLLKVESVF